jgi:hypothetical protein
VKPNNDDPMNTKDRFVDDLLTGALARYSRVEARPGLEERVLRAVREQQDAARPWTAALFNWRWASLAAAAALVIVISVVLAYRSPTPREVVNTKVPLQTPTTKAPETPTERASATESASIAPGFRGAVQLHRQTDAQATEAAPQAARITKPASPRQPQFPSSAVPTGQELLLAQVAAQADPVHMAALATVAGAGIKPLEDEIKPLEIAPLSGTTEESATSTVAPVPQPPK